MGDKSLDEAVILDAVRALEAADAPLRARDWPALEDPQLRDLVGGHLAALGRQIIEVPQPGGGPPVDYFSGWADDVASHIAEDPSDLELGDLAILTLIYLRSEVLEEVLHEEVLSIGEHLDDHRGPDGRDVIRGVRLEEALRRLRAHQLLTRNNKLGPAFKRLGPAQRKRLEENFILLLRPDGLWAREIRLARGSASTEEVR